LNRMNWKRILLGGLAAGLVINVSEGVLNAIVLQQDWAEVMRSMNRPTEVSAGQIAMFNVWGFLIGISAVWLYAAIRPRYGQGPKTALCAGLAVWWLAYFMGAAGNIIMGLFPARLMIIGMVVGIVEVTVGLQLGAWLYREGEPETKVIAARAS
jgi:hypothetical protein